MREWIPISTSPKGRLVLAAVAEFGAHTFDAVTVGDLAAAAGVTTGALYHHFGSKLGLYSFVRDDVERRMLDRVEGALAARPEAVIGALLVGFDYATSGGFLHLLGTPPEGSANDRLAEALEEIAETHSPALGRVLAAAWRAALAAVADGVPADDARAALAMLHVLPIAA
jgi:AcrR family transcriptional regulator